MRDKILKQIANIDKSLRWIKAHKAEEYEKRFLDLVEERRKLRRIAETERDNPAMAAYGMSQVGKSYLMSNMLQQEVTLPDGKKAIKPFEVEAGGVKYNFIDEMNPISNGAEATGVVTRFSSFSRDPERYSKQYPVLMKCLSAADMTLVVCDGYFYDVQTPEATESCNEINKHADELYEKYCGRDVQHMAPITPDDVLDMKYYFKKNIMKNAQEINKSYLFDKLALVIDRVPVDEYVDVFSYLWLNDANLSRLYEKVLKILATLQFHQDIYLPVDAVLHKGIKPNTILSVDCLNQFITDDCPYHCSAFLRQSDGSYSERPNMAKADLSAVCAEVVYRIGEDFLNGAGEYDLTYMQPDVKAQLQQGRVSYDLLKTTDLLDFPGARSRQQNKIAALQEPTILTQVLLRGKVAYLFNKYCEAKQINILLYCHHGEKNEVTTIPDLLENWVNLYVGQTADERRRTVEIAGGLSPLFYIGTMFNKDMALDRNDAANRGVALMQRWDTRFKKVLYKECFAADKVDWVKNWTRQGESFQNSFLLRDFKYSGERASKIYSGFDMDKGEKERDFIVSQNYLYELRQSFCESEDAEMFFRNRALSWDVAATMNNDGSLYIIQQLTRAAAAMERVRDAQFQDTQNNVLTHVLGIMKSYYVSDDTGELLIENKYKAFGIERELDTVSDNRPELLGHMLQALQLTEAACREVLHNLIRDLSNIVTTTSDIKDYGIIRSRCNNFSGCNTESEKWDLLVTTYHFRSRDEAAAFMQRKGVDIQKLFAAEVLSRKNSAVISHTIVNIWKERIQGPEFKNMFKDYIDIIALNDLVACLISTAQSVRLEQILEQEISDYVDVLNNNNINQNLVADMVATTVSDFVMDFGYRYLTQEQIATARRVAKENPEVQCFCQIDKPRKEQYDNEEMTELFRRIMVRDMSEGGNCQHSESYMFNYNSWREYMFVAFIAHLNVPDFDRAANEELKLILKEMEEIG